MTTEELEKFNPSELTPLSTITALFSVTRADQNVASSGTGILIY